LRRIIKSFKIDEINSFKKKLFNWSKSYKTSVFLDSNSYQSRLGSYETILAVDSYSKLPFTNKNSLKKLEEYKNKTKDWLFGYFSYDLKNELENLTSINESSFYLPNLFFFQPKKIWIIKSNYVQAQYLNELDILKDWEVINSIKLEKTCENNHKVNLVPRLSKSQYIDKIKKMLLRINRGDIYEANFCMEWFSDNSNINPENVYHNLNQISKTPMSAFFKENNFYLISTSPERFIKRIDDRIISQPIKGTSRRDSDNLIDLNLKKELYLNNKERSENIMIVDLVRNDLSRFSIPGSVRVSELCEVYPFEQIHQMISTVECKIHKDLSLLEIIKSTFPMGSMTGAPKIKALEIIEDLEMSNRGLYSGALGYIDPNGNFDFNVIIRSLIYDSEKKYLSFHVGSAITSKSNPNNEYEECLLKAGPMMSIFR